MSDDLQLDLTDPLKTLSRARRLKREGKMTEDEYARIRAECFAAMGNAGVKAIQHQNEPDAED